MKQFLLSSFPDAKGTVRLSGKDFHYLVRVRRLEKGSVLKALLPNGEQTELTILSIEAETILGQCASVGNSPLNNGDANALCCPNIILFQSLPKSPKMDIIVRQLTETGVAVIAPFFSEYSTAKTEKTDRWERIIKEARQQSGSLVPTAIRTPSSFEGILDYWKEMRKEQPGTTGILLHHIPLEEGTFHDYLYNDTPQVVLAVGPEGGFSTEEANRFIAEGFKPLFLGSAVLRVDTAAIYAAAVVRTILLEKAAWRNRNN